uniref:Ovule protein n=1 Tax=Brugia timori TaxID=42155 RepID=A0A0R3Q8Q5_9BILA
LNVTDFVIRLLYDDHRGAVKRSVLHLIVIPLLISRVILLEEKKRAFSEHKPSGSEMLGEKHLLHNILYH